MGRQKTPNNVPGWFDVGRYKALDQFNAQQWAIIQISRLKAKEWLERLRNGNLEAKKHLDAHFEKIKSDPLLGLPHGSYIFAQMPDPVTGKVFGAIQPLTVGSAVRLLELWRGKNAENSKVIDVLALRLRGDMKTSFSPADFELIDQDIAPRRNIVAVNLDLGDKKLLAGFMGWLASARSAKAPNSREVRGGRLLRWADTGIVPYVDLCQWGEYAGTRITQRKIADALNGMFPPEESKDEQAVGRTLKKEAELWLSEDVQHQLAAEIAASPPKQ